MTLTKDMLVELIKSKLGSHTKTSREALEVLLEEIKVRLEKGKDVKISGFGKWMVREKKSRPGRNPHTGKKIEITARRVVTFHPSDKLRARIEDGDNRFLTEGACDESLYKNWG